MTLEYPFEANAALDIIDVLSVITKKLSGRRCEVTWMKNSDHNPHLTAILEHLYETMTRRRYKVARINLALIPLVATV
jgi:hypothetical protein